ncbi:hypothetical protein [Saccharopolyspora tripterygii]
MPITAALIEPKIDATWFADRLTTVATFFAAQPKPADDGRAAEPRSAIPGRVDHVPGEPVDTSHHDESHYPVASSEAPGNHDPAESRKRSNKRRE